MNRLILVFLLAFLTGLPTFSAENKKGFDAIDKGDYATALKELKPLAEQGNARAQYNLGALYFEGKGVSRDDKKAFKWLRLSANQGNAKAQVGLAAIYASGKGVSKNFKTAAKWLKLAAEQGNATAQHGIATYYVEGLGVLQDYSRAHMWFNLSASQGHVFAELSRDERNKIEKKMTIAQIAEAQRMAHEWKAKHQQ